jgi:hypothetical protein
VADFDAVSAHQGLATSRLISGAYGGRGRGSEEFKASNGTSPCFSHQLLYKDSSTGGKVLPPILKPKTLLAFRYDIRSEAIEVAASRMLRVPTIQATARE